MLKWAAMLRVMDGRVLLCEGLIIMDETFMLYGKACYTVFWVDQFICCVDNQNMCYGWKILIAEEALGVFWMPHFHLTGKHTVVCSGWTNLPAV